MSLTSATERLSPERSTPMPWVALAFGAWLVGGFQLVFWAIERGLAPDVTASPFHLPVYAGIVCLALAIAALVVRAVRRKRARSAWREALPTGYGTLGIGAAVLIGAIILDVGWREGVGIFGLEETLAPSRILIVLGLVLVAGTPLWAALVLPARAVPAPVIAGSCALVLAVLAWPGGYHPAYSPWLEVPADRPNQRGELWVMDRDGSRQTRLVEPSGEHDAGYASWSPDASRIAFTDFLTPDDDFGRASASVVTVAADGSDRQVVVETGDFSWIPRWSPDGEWIAYTREALGGPFSVAAPVGPGQAAGPQGGAVVGPLSVPLPQAEIWRVSADGGTPEQLTDGPGDDRAPVYSPDGTQILFDSTRDGNTEIYVMEADGSNPRRLTTDPAEEWGASWSPDGSMIAFNSSRTGHMEIYVMAADGSGVTRLTFDDAANVAPTWAPDGSRIAFTSRGDDETGQIMSITPNGGELRDLGRSPATSDDVWTGSWGPDGRIAFVRRMPDPPYASGIARIDLGAAAMLLTTVVIAIVVALLARTAPPFGSYSVALGLAGVLVAIPMEAWRMIAVGLVTGLAVDVGAWRVPPGRRGAIASGTAAAVFVLASAAAVIAGDGLEWSPTLLIGVAVAAAALGIAIGVVSELQRQPSG